MNVYEAIEASPIGVAWHKDTFSVVSAKANWIKPWAEQYPDGWKPLAMIGTEPHDFCKALAKRYKDRIAELKEQLAGQYTLGEQLTEPVKGQRYIAVCNETGEMRQNQFTATSVVMNSLWNYYADPRPLPKLPEKKPRYTLRDCGAYWRVLRDEQSLCVCENRLDAEGLVMLLNESEAKDDN